jgi:hypothetical protein
VICERCGEIGETFVTEKHGELCEACQKLAEQEGQGSAPARRRPLGPGEG